MTWMVLSWVVAAVLGLFAFRRVFMLSSLFTLRPGQEEPSIWPEDLDVVILAPMRNETARAHAVLRALDRIESPPGKVQIVLGDDASTDGTAAMLTAWAKGRDNFHTYLSPAPLGKAALLNRMLAAAPGKPFALVAVYDAKHCPEPGSLRLLVAAMQDPRTGCVSGYLQPRNAGASLVARYAALESWVTQLIDHEGRERGGISSPAMGGNCVYRRAAVDEAGGFAEGAFSEDIEMSLAMQGAGWRTRFLSGARATNTVAQTLSEFWRQRLRWNKGLYSASCRARQTSGWVTVAGYGDRLALLASFCLALGGWLPLYVPAVYAALPALVIGAAVAKAKALREAPAIALSVVLLFPVDLAVSFWAAVQAVLGRRPSWR